jgi:uncharacterized protein
MAEAYAIFAWDAPDGTVRRAEQREPHFAHMEAVMDHIRIAGPLYAGDGRIIGSMFVVMADSAADAEALLRTDPFCSGGVWERWEVHRYLPAAGTWIGGKTW